MVIDSAAVFRVGSPAAEGANRASFCLTMSHEKGTCHENHGGEEARRSD